MRQVLLVQAPDVDFEALLKAAKIPVQCLDNPDAMISYQQLKAFVQATLQATKQFDLGVLYGKQLNINSFDELGMAILSSPTGRDAILLVMKYIKTQMPLIDLQLKPTETDAILKIKTKYLRGPLQRFVLDAAVASFHTIRGYLLNKNELVNTVYFSYPKPDRVDAYQETFGQQIHFDTEQTEYHFPKTDLDHVFPLANPTVLKIAEEKCQQKLKELENYADLESMVKRILVAKPGRFPQLSEIAQHLYMSERTLKRHLQQLNTNYQTILDNLRKELAIKYLSTTDIKIADIAELLNYSDSSNFANAFKKWTGQSPTNFRKI